MAKSEAAKKTAEDARKAFQEQREQMNKANEEATLRVTRAKPTPTQEENDLARIGIHVDEKEDDGSGENVIVQRSMIAGQPVGPHGYETRAAKGKKESSSY